MQKVDMNFILAGLAVSCSWFGIGLYIRGILQGKIKPHLFTWLIWVVTMAIAATAQWQNGGGIGALATTMGAINCSVISWLAWRYGDRQYTCSDWVFLLAAIAAIPFWALTNSALSAVIWVTLIDLLGFLPSYRKAYYKPLEEKMLSYILFIIQYSLSIWALTEKNGITVTYPLAMIIACLLMIIILLWRRSLTKLQ